MWIALGIIAAVIVAVLLLPVRLVVKSGEKESVVLEFKVLCFTFGGKPKPDSDADKAVKKAGGTETSLKDRIGDKGLTQTLSEIYGLVVELLKTAVKLLGRCVITKLRIQIRCSGNDAAATAIHYGQCCTATHGLLTALRAIMTVRQKGCDIDIGCDFTGSESLFRYHVEVSVRVCHVLAAAIRLLFSEKIRKVLLKK
ncbi:MAG: hypothetical protein IJZ56_01630 [Oscillospiraceae bacterium]|nr:hypothetical protein [Oscillospiraceae bacterium]